MKNNDFEKACKKILVEYYNDKYGIIINEKDVFIVWSCKTLQNNKALLGTTNPDNYYYEFTFNGDEEEIYFDEYVKVFNRAYSVDTEKKCISYSCLADSDYGISINY